jgi:hypothetical protein
MANRRQFLIKCSAAAVTGTLLPVELWAATSRFKTVASSEISFESFASVVNTDFQVRGGSGSVVLELVEVTGNQSYENPNAEDAANEKFSLLFRGLITEELTQNTYRFEHPSLGGFDLFIARVGRKDPLVCYYEAVFNRPPKPTTGTLRRGVIVPSKPATRRGSRIN